MKRSLGVGGSVVSGVILIVLAAAIFAMGMNDFAYLFTGSTEDIYSVTDIDATEGKYVTVPIDAILDNYAECVHTQNFVTTSTDRYYLVWLDADNSTGYDLISISASSSEDIEKLNSIMDTTWDCLDGYTDGLNSALSFTGRLTPMDSDETKYYDESLDYIFDTYLSDYNICYYNIDMTTTRGSIVVGFVLALFFLAVGVYYIIAAVRVSKMKKIQAGINQNTYDGNTSASVQSPYSTDDYQSHNNEDT